MNCLPLWEFKDPMYEVRITKTFRKDAERCRKRGYDMELLKHVIRLLERDGVLSSQYRAHKLSGNYEGCWECHIKESLKSLILPCLRAFG